jgi:NAD(P)-dependent dehydrogenase (short-subunit alcohol dehydrogenase family)
MRTPVVLITGGAGGIGAATARRLHDDGARIVIVDRDATAGRRVAKEVDGLFIAADVGDLHDNRRAVAAVIDAYRRLDVVVLNAAIPGGCDFDDFSADAYRATMRTNLDGVVYGVHAALPHLRRHGGGSCVVTASIAGLTSSPDIFYASSKHALVGLVRSAAPALAAHGIRINALCPALVDTPAISRIRTSLIEHGVPLAHPDEVATALAAVIADPRTGQIWTIHPGQPAALLPPPTNTPYDYRSAV